MGRGLPAGSPLLHCKRDGSSCGAGVPRLHRSRSDRLAGPNALRARESVTPARPNRHRPVRHSSFLIPHSSLRLIPHSSLARRAVSETATSENFWSIC